MFCEKLSCLGSSSWKEDGKPEDNIYEKDGITEDDISEQNNIGEEHILSSSLEDLQQIPKRGFKTYKIEQGGEIYLHAKYLFTTMVYNISKCLISHNSQMCRDFY